MKDITYLFYLLFTASWVSSIFILLWLVVRRQFSKLLNPKVVHIVWLLILVKLLIVVAPQSPMNLLQQLTRVLTIEWGSDTVQSADSENTGLGQNDVNVQQQTSSALSGLQDESRKTVAQQSALSHASVKQAQGNFPLPYLTWLQLVSILWLGGLVGLIGYYLFSVAAFRRIYRQARRIEHPEVLAILEASKAKLGIR